MRNTITIIVLSVALLGVAILIISLMRVRKSLKEAHGELNKIGDNDIFLESELSKQIKGNLFFIIALSVLFILLLMALIIFIGRI